MNFPHMKMPFGQPHQLGRPNFGGQDRRPSMPVFAQRIVDKRRQSLPVISLQNQSAVGKVKCKFTPAEDKMLEELVHQYGELDWDTISSQMPGRNPRQCKDRWTRYLSPNLNKSEWTPEEERLLLQLVYELDFRWVQIAKRFPGRTDNQIKNKWNVMKKSIETNGIYQFNHFQFFEKPRPNIPMMPNYHPNMPQYSQFQYPHSTQIMMDPYQNQMPQQQVSNMQSQLQQMQQQIQRMQQQMPQYQPQENMLEPGPYMEAPVQSPSPETSPVAEEIPPPPPDPLDSMFSFGSQDNFEDPFDGDSFFAMY